LTFLAVSDVPKVESEKPDEKGREEKEKKFKVINEQLFVRRRDKLVSASLSTFIKQVKVFLCGRSRKKDANYPHHTSADTRPKEKNL
jgi:hypothetical protein